VLLVCLPELQPLKVLPPELQRRLRRAALALFVGDLVFEEWYQRWYSPSSWLRNSRFAQLRCWRARWNQNKQLQRQVQLQTGNYRNERSSWSLIALPYSFAAPARSLREQ
jgi:hypothetical protein